MAQVQELTPGHTASKRQSWDLNLGSLGHSLGSYPLHCGHCRCSPSGSCGCHPSFPHAEDGSCVRAVAQLSPLPSGCDAGSTQPCNLIPARHETHQGDWAEFLGLCVCICTSVFVHVQACVFIWVFPSSVQWESIEAWHHSGNEHWYSGLEYNSFSNKKNGAC